MTSIMIRGGLLAVFLACAAGAARADTVEVKVPFPFVVGTRTMPAGEYRVQSDTETIRLVGEKGTKAQALIMTIPASRRAPGDVPSLRFTHSETGYRLVDMWESASEGFEIDR